MSDKILGNRTRRISLTVNRNPVLLRHNGLGPAGREYVYIFRWTKCFCQLARRIVVSRYDIGTNPGLLQTHHLPREKQSGVVVFPIAVIEITGQKNERDALLDRQIHQVFQRAAARAANLIDRRTLVALQAAERAVEVEVCCVKKFQLNSTTLVMEGSGETLRHCLKIIGHLRLRINR